MPKTPSEEDVVASVRRVRAQVQARFKTLDAYLKYMEHKSSARLRREASRPPRPRAAIGACR